ncbi:glycosyltransferase [Crocosphaera sp. UHCC 0190]|uniref:glycosyltransferase family 2 protein n=1 Tax=Crocosphaera sp. UHCC 0190 TaxID=3110246 RepID=UPI002B1ED4F0|nr:glycosyltransferase [Crocosphaera sp. UHCC 0190]MEA5511027.1 glycosyltransferase [Crocosphaera sp. UHCC 0190]
MVLPWKILQIDLSQGISAISTVSEAEKIYLVFWWKTIPLGHQAILAEQLPLSAIAIVNLAIQAITPTIGYYLFPNGFRESLVSFNDSYLLSCKTESVDWTTLVKLEKSLAELEQKIAEIDTKPFNKNISLIICTRNRPESLTRCLESLQKLSHFPKEIIIVDNASISSDKVKQMTELWGMRYIHEPRKGLSIARNTGIRQATGEIIAFTDDDVVVHPDWIFRLGQTFSDPNLMAVTGQVLPAELETESQQIFEVELGSFGWGYRPKTFDHGFFDYNLPWGVPVWRIGAGANMAFRRQILDKVGNFDERLGAGASGCSEDSEMWYRILAEGGICLYEPTAVVFHYHRREMTDLNQQMYAYMKGHVTALLIQYEHYHHKGNLYRVFVDLPKHYLGVLMAGFFYGFGLKQKTLLSEVLGCIAGLFYYLRHRYQK